MRAVTGPPPTLLLVRHGRTEWNRLGRVQGTTDVPLDRLGRAQADRLADVLADRRIAGIFSSPLARARETAERIRAKHRHRPSLVLLDELRELDYGSCQGMLPAEWATVDPDLERRWRTEPWRVRFPKGETLAQVRRRADDAIARLRDRTFDPDSAILVVAHGHILRALILQLWGLPAERFWRIDVPNASILTVPSSLAQRIDKRTSTARHGHPGQPSRRRVLMPTNGTHVTERCTAHLAGVLG